jgi:hypothetical protein
VTASVLPAGGLARLGGEGGGGGGGRRATATVASLVALLAGGFCVWLALAHPLSPGLALVFCGLVAAVVLVQPLWWPACLLGLLPLLGLMPWTGWITTEEFDLAVLAVAAGGYARLAWGLPAKVPTPDPFSATPPVPGVPNLAGMVRAYLWLLPLLGSTLVSMQIGVAAAGGLEWGWWQGYREPLNSLRLSKPIFEVLLLLPLWRAIGLADAARADRAFRLGLLLLLGLTAGVVVAERVAFVGLLNFSSDYRATGPFWEMHVGGAALDAALSAGLPFAVAALFLSKSPLRWAPLGALLVLGAYAALVTFSRIVLAAVPLGALVWWGLQARQAAWTTSMSASVHSIAPLGPLSPHIGHRSAQSKEGTGLLQALVGLVGFALLAWWCFPSSGYRGLLAFAAALAVLLPLAGLLRTLSLATWVLGVGLGLLGAGAVVLATLYLPRGAYLGFGAAWLATAALAWQGDKDAWAALLNTGNPNGATAPAADGLGGARVGGANVGGANVGGAAGAVVLQPSLLSTQAAPLALAAYVTTLSAFVAIAWHWGGAAAVPPVGVTVVLLFLLSCAAAAYRPVRRKQTLWPASPRWQVQTVAAMVLVAAVIGVFVGGGYMRQRVTEVQRDGGGRQEHWAQSLQMLNGADWVFGQGLGRFAANRALTGRVEDQTGDYRLQSSIEGGQHLALSSGKHAMGSGEYLRVSQRIVLPAAGPLRLQLKLRNTAPVQLWAEVCEKHLLYENQCIAFQQNIKPLLALASPDKAGPWQTVELSLADKNGGHSLQAWAGAAPRWIVFSVALADPGQRADLDNLVLTDAAGQSLLSNGDFEKGLARWFFSSDKNHLPWHAKNLPLHLLMEQGLVGLIAFSLATVVALWRLCWGGAKGHALAPLLAAGLVGLLVVGAIDSLLDMPRIAFLLLWMIGMALALPAPGDAAPKLRRSRSAGGRGSGRGSGRRRRSSSRSGGRSPQRDGSDSNAST